MLLGAVADDLTGATDLSLMLASNGMNTVQYIGVPGADADFGGADAVVVALKSRTAPVAEAIADSVASARALLEGGAEQFVFKYCSTFDSTAEGNIGPVAEALLELVDSPIAIACPAFPAAGRSIYQGHLFVGDRLLSESPMKDHPLTPMRDSDLVRVLQHQSRGKVGLLPLATIASGATAVQEAIAAAQRTGFRLLIADAVSDDDLRILGTALAGARLVTGGSGIAMGLPDNFRRRGVLGEVTRETRMRAAEGRSVILAGSCSTATRGQVEAAIAAGLPAIKIDPMEVAAGRQTAVTIADWIMAQDARRPVLAYSSEDPKKVKEVQQLLGRNEAGELVERLLADIGSLLARNGFTRFIVAGGETSGAVVDALGVRALHIGPKIAAGVPWTRSIGPGQLALALKSGNFGAPDFFVRAWDLLGD